MPKVKLPSFYAANQVFSLLDLLYVIYACVGPVMSFHIIIRIAEDPRRADQSTVIRINLSREVRQEAGRSVGARVVDGGLGGP